MYVCMYVTGDVQEEWYFRCRYMRLRKFKVVNLSPLDIFHLDGKPVYIDPVRTYRRQESTRKTRIRWTGAVKDWTKKAVVECI